MDGLLATRSDLVDPMGAAVIAAAHLDLCHDSRTFARIFGVAHALVIRAVTTLSDEAGLLEVEHRSERSQRIRYRLTSRGQALAAPVAAWASARPATEA